MAIPRDLFSSGGGEIRLDSGKKFGYVFSYTERILTKQRRVPGKKCNTTEGLKHLSGKHVVYEIIQTKVGEGQNPIAPVGRKMH